MGKREFILNRKTFKFQICDSIYKEVLEKSFAAEHVTNRWRSPVKCELFASWVVCRVPVGLASSWRVCFTETPLFPKLTLTRKAQINKHHQSLSDSVGSLGRLGEVICYHGLLPRWCIAKTQSLKMGRRQCASQVKNLTVRNCLWLEVQVEG